MTAPGAPRAARRLVITGVVQGVGFRPFVHRLALRHHLAGWVRNTAGEVVVHAEGDPAALDLLEFALVAEAPPLARVDRITPADVPLEGHRRFDVLASEASSAGRPAIPPDVALCAACATELRDPANRRFGYPFITCTDCGPRYTVVEALPYDRQRTAMRAFPMCPACAAEYESPGDRRFHSETNSCAACGPTAQPTIAEAAAVLRAGQILAIRGMGGFHLACDATDDAAVRRLRERKRREHKPFAVMVASLEEARVLVQLDDRAAELLDSRERPIVLLPSRAGNGIAPAVAPGLATLGVMLASTPLHLLLLDEVRRPLVMTSGNLSDEPIVAGNDEAWQRLGAVADAFLCHDREIVARCDDSVLRPAPSGPVVLRRARGFAPLPLDLPLALPRPVVALGAQLKHTFALAAGDVAWLSPHQGDLDHLETLEHVQATAAHFRALFRVEPEVAVHDAHPGYLSTRLALELDLPTIAVQHHHAHLAAVAAEHGVTGTVVGLAFDGTGLGDDGHVWGAEVLLGDLATASRVGQLRYVPLPGGDRAARAPWRVLMGIASLDDGVGPAFDAALAAVPATERGVVATQLARRLNAPLASSMGRLFDAAACLLGLRTESFYEGQAAMELEALAGAGQGPSLPFPIVEADGRWQMDPLPLLLALADRRRRGEAPATLAAAFHDAVAATAVELAARAAELGGSDTVVLGGGSFQNVRLLETVRDGLAARRLRPLRPLRLSPNDGAIAFGQVAVAAARLWRDLP